MKKKILGILVLGFLCLLAGYTYVGIQTSFSASGKTAGRVASTGDEGGSSKPFGCRLLGDEGGPTKPFTTQC